MEVADRRQLPVGTEPCRGPAQVRGHGRRRAAVQHRHHGQRQDSSLYRFGTLPLRQRRGQGEEGMPTFLEAAVTGFVQSHRSPGENPTGEHARRRGSERGHSRSGG